MTCPHCGRPLALARPSCFYCGRPLPPELVAAATAAAAAESSGAQTPTPRLEADPAGRFLVILDLRQPGAPALAAALGIPAFEAAQRLRRGGYQLHRVVAGETAAAAELARIASHGVRGVMLPEREALVEPQLVRGGRLEPGRLRARVGDGRLEWSRDDLLLVVKGPIRRERQAEDRNPKRIRTAAPSDGFRFHLHRLRDPRPLELDPDAFEFEAERGQPGSSLLRLGAWIDAFDPPALVDDGFRLLPPALGVAEPDPGATRALGGAEHKPAALMLDNLRQFRAFSGWRGALERRARG